jgi:hypothetical protein
MFVGANCKEVQVAMFSSGAILEYNRTELGSKEKETEERNSTDNYSGNIKNDQHANNDLQTSLHLH